MDGTSWMLVAKRPSRVARHRTARTSSRTLAQPSVTPPGGVTPEHWADEWPCADYARSVKNRAASWLAIKRASPTGVCPLRFAR